MTPNHARAIRSSWSVLEPIQDDVAALFYERLFDVDPTAQRLFGSTDMAVQRAALMQTLTLVVRGVDRLEELVPALEALGRRHATYGVTADHYESVGAALMWTLAQTLGNAFTADVSEAWAAAYVALASVMLAAAEKAAATAA
jgi:hemoglobin-like flavoprotein